ncbi:MAG: FMN reductase [Flavobacteriaceae bacterium]|nr:FMN reductase [Flavobacteriaceae bacterium]
MENKTLIIQGSSRSHGDTNLIVDHLIGFSKYDHIKLTDYNISHFDYDHKNHDDDFIPLMEKIIKEYRTLLFITPVYWYSMSGRMKVFFDRISDLLHYRKDLGRQLRGKNMAMISVSNANDLISGFNRPFIESANYLGMNYLGDVHAWVENGKINQGAFSSIDDFNRLIFEQ